MISDFYLGDSLGTYIRKKRKYKFPTLSMNQFAKMIGVSASWYSKVERDTETPSFDRCIELARRFNVHTDDILLRVQKYKDIIDFARIDYVSSLECQERVDRSVAEVRRSYTDTQSKETNS